MRVNARWLARSVPVFLAGVAFAAPGDGPADVGFTKQVQLSPSEIAAQSKQYLQDINKTFKDVKGLEDEAQRRKDVIRLNCVRDKREKIGSSLTLADKSYAELNEAASRSDDGERQHQFTRLTILNQKVTELGLEARNCIGADIPVPGTQGVTLEIDPSIPPEDPTVWRTPPLEPPPRFTEASATGT